MRPTTFAVLAIITCLSLPTQADSIIGKQLLSGCETFNGFISNCQFVQTALTGRFRNEMEFHVRYVYACQGHTINVGISASGPDGALIKFTPTAAGEGALVTFVGHGPVQTVDRDDIGIASAEFSTGCDLRISDFGYDLSDTSKALFDRQISTLDALQIVLSKTKAVEALVSTIKTLVTTIDVPTMSSLFRVLYFKTKVLADSYQVDHSAEKNAILDVLDELQARICDNPPLREGNGDVCGEPPNLENAAPNVATLRQLMNESVKSISDKTKDAVDSVATAFAGVLVDTWSLVSEAPEQPKGIYKARVCEKILVAGLTDSHCL